VNRLGWTGVIAIVAGRGVPMVLLVNAGLLLTRATHGGALSPGVMPLMVAILAAMILKLPFSTRTRGRPCNDCDWCCRHRLGARWCCTHSADHGARDVSARGVRTGWVHRGDAAHAPRWPPFRRDSGGRLAGPIPSHLCKHRRNQRLQGPVFDIALQAIVQGLLTAIVALMLYGRMVSVLGATSGAASVALTPG
jgi:hypothetical protein